MKPSSYGCLYMDASKQQVILIIDQEKLYPIGRKKKWKFVGKCGVLLITAHLNASKNANMFLHDIKPFMSNGLLYLHSSDRSIYNIRGVWEVLLLPYFIEIHLLNANNVDPVSDAAFCGVWSGSILFANVPFTNGLKSIFRSTLKSL